MINEEEVKPLDIQVTIKRGDKYYINDLAFLTHDEVIEWLHQVFPVLEFNKIKPNEFTSRASKASLFDSILAFNSAPLFPNTGPKQ